MAHYVKPDPGADRIGIYLADQSPSAGFSPWGEVIARRADFQPKAEVEDRALADLSGSRKIAANQKSALRHFKRQLTQSGEDAPRAIDVLGSFRALIIRC